MTSSVGPLDVRLVGPGEWAVWREIRLRSLRDSPTAFGSTYEREDGFSDVDWHDRLQPPTVLAYDGSEGGDQDRPVGMGGGFEDPPGWLHVVAMWVEPSWRGRGVGGRILDELSGWAAAHGLRTHLDVTVGNGGAQALYERHGFVATGETRPLRTGSPHRVERMILAE